MFRDVNITEQDDATFAALQAQLPQFGRQVGGGEIAAASKRLSVEYHSFTAIRPVPRVRSNENGDVADMMTLLTREKRKLQVQATCKRL